MLMFNLKFYVVLFIALLLLALNYFYWVVLP